MKTFEIKRNNQVFTVKVINRVTVDNYPFLINILHKTERLPIYGVTFRSSTSRPEVEQWANLRIDNFLTNPDK